LSFRSTERPFTFRFVELDSKRHLELTNTTEQTLRQVEILTVFLKREQLIGSDSQVHISFQNLELIRSLERAVMVHRTWLDGKPAQPEQDQLKMLEPIAGKACPYVLDISWQDVDGKTRFQRIPVGHHE
jgi:hypothetical protein